jgi:hypothetical protein
VTDDGTPNLDNSQTITISVLKPLNFSTISRSGAQLTLGWESAPGQTYRVVYKDDLNDPTWTALDPLHDLLASGSSLSVIVAVDAPPHRFFAVQLVE